MLLDHASCYRAICAKDARFDGRIFTAVVTTGIYCRPICPARVPKSANVRFYPSAAGAQEAGYRPCLRCRPETAPDTPAWRGSGAIIGRALRLIDEGGLDDHGVGHLAARLGVGDRHLRRLFLRHVGATPSAVAQTRRVLLAKQLLHETDMPMAEVAMASGFGSIRRFNEIFQTLFERPPLEIRRGLKRKVLTTTGGGLLLKLRFRPPYDWKGVQSFLYERQYSSMEAIVDGHYARSFLINGHAGIVQVGEGGSDWLQVRVTTPNIVVLPKLIAHVRHAFDLGADPQAIAAHLAGEPVMAALSAHCVGMRVPCSWSGFEGVVRAVLGQQITVKAAIALGSLFVARLGARLSDHGLSLETLTHIFPTPQVVQNADLSFLPMPKSRQETIKLVAAAFVEDPDFLIGPLDVVRARLGAIKGIGKWTIDYVALRVLRDCDAFPANDVALLRAFGVRAGRKIDAAALEIISQPWRPWRAYGAQHLWASLADNKPVKSGC